MMPKSVKRFSDNIMPSHKGMMPKSVKRFSDNIMLHLKRGIAAPLCGKK
jgi:hypothetical protein